MPFLYEKSQLRKKVNNQINNFLKVYNFTELSKKICSHLLPLSGLAGKGAVWASFKPLKGEPDPSFFEKRGKDLKFVFPRISKKSGLCFHFADKGFEKSPLGFLQPKQEGKACAVKDIDVFLLPGLAFDRAGFRLGRGAGFYDKLFSSSLARGVKIGLSFSWSIKDRLPRQKHDKALDILVTDQFVLFPIKKHLNPQLFKKNQKRTA